MLDLLFCPSQQHAACVTIEIYSDSQMLEKEKGLRNGLHKRVKKEELKKVKNGRRFEKIRKTVKQFSSLKISVCDNILTEVSNFNASRSSRLAISW